jgi:pre-mRNA-processing factor 6
MPKSKKLWLFALRKDSEGNQEDVKKRRSEILKKALEFLPNDLDLWKDAISLEDEIGARKLLEKAVECIPHSTELWLALANLSDYENAKIVLNKAITTIPSDHTIWVNAAKLEEV